MNFSLPWFFVGLFVGAAVGWVGAVIIIDRMGR
jgi:hypothetical protein